jgi:hypothetical protein
VHSGVVRRAVFHERPCAAEIDLQVKPVEPLEQQDGDERHQLETREQPAEPAHGHPCHRHGDTPPQ